MNEVLLPVGAASTWCVYHVPHWDALAHRDRIGRVRLSKRDHLLYIGVFSSQHAAQKAVESIKSEPGFVDEPDCFIVIEYSMDVDLWPQGFDPKWRRQEGATSDKPSGPDGLPASGKFG